MKNSLTFGKCTLVGAGPGDPDLLTIKALKAIQTATVLFVDDLVSADIVAYAPPSARIVYVGKRGGCKSIPSSLAGAAKRSSTCKKPVSTSKWSTESPPAWPQSPR